MPREAANIKLSFVGSNTTFTWSPSAVSTRTSLSSPAATRRTGRPTCRRGGRRYVNLYPGIDLELTGEQGELFPRLASARRGPSRVRLLLEGTDTVAIDGDALRLSTAAGNAIWPLFRAETPISEASAARAEPWPLKWRPPWPQRGPISP